MNKPLVVLLSRSFHELEKKEFYKHFTNVVELNQYNLDKKLTDFPPADSVVVVDLRETAQRDWWGVNCKLTDANDPIIWVRASSDEDKGETLKYKYDCKRVRTDQKNKVDFLHQLFQTTIAPVVGRKKKLLGKLVDCVCGSSDK